MSLRHGVLGLLVDGPASGYDLLKIFDRSLAYVWPATQSQLYGELNRLAEDGLIVASEEGPRRRKEYTITPAGRSELERWLTDDEPDRIRRNDAMLRVFFLGTLKPEQAKAYLEREANVHENLEQLLSDIARTTDWDTQAFDAYGRLVVESGIRYAHTQAEWARWAAEQVDGLGAPNQRSSKVGVGQSG
ncbi:MAG TPA: PadR family transcriptional regulator [Acidimicrobiia bacterium]|nr:PadR family transcriptional regulator [Acidimicrobiia bacterium]